MSPYRRAPRNAHVLLAWYNALVSVLWSVLAFSPLYVFCYRFVPRSWLFAFAATSLSAYVLPSSQFRFLELSSRPRAYRRLGVRFFNRFVQDGEFIIESRII
jgi:hypothetical protein